MGLARFLPSSRVPSIMARSGLSLCRAAGLAAVVVGLAAAPPDEPAPEKDPQIGETFHVPYRRTLTNHYLVRVRINGQGPFNLLVDTGAPALFVSTAAAKAVGLGPDEDEFWTPVEMLEIEGGITLRNMKARVEDPFQLQGMNALGLPGATIDGILGFTILARFRMEFDPTKDRMAWTRLDYEPKEPFVPKNPDARRAPADVQAMNMLGPMMKFLSFFVGKQAEDILAPQGLLGIEIEEREGKIVVTRALPGTPAEAAGLQPGDVLEEVHRSTVEKLESTHEAIAGVRPGEEVTLKLKRGDESIEATLKAAEGF
jgi:hypothetical protein